MFSFYGWIVGLTTCALGMLIVVFSSPKNSSSHYSKHIKNPEKTYKLVITEVLKPTSFSKRYVARIKRLDSKPVSGHILLSTPKDSTLPPFIVDDALLAHGSLKEFKASLNPHQFNYKAYMDMQGLYHQLRLDPKEFIAIKKPSWTLVGKASNFRDFTIRQLKSYPFGSEELAVIEAILLGQRNDLSNTTYDSYKDAGAVHILALSGLHIGILLLVLQFVLSPLKRLPKGQKIQLLITLLLLWTFAFIAGLSASIVRAVTMFSFVAYAMYLNRPTNTLNVIALSLFCLLLVKPLYLFQVGFQMSYAAVFAIVWLYPKLERFWRPRNIVLRKIWQLLSVSCTAQLGVLPISLFYFHQFPGLFFVSNLIVVPFLGIVLGLGVLVLLLSNLAILPAFLAHFYNTIIKLMNEIVAWVATQQTFVLKDISFDGAQLLLSYFLLVASVFALSKPKFKNILWSLLAIIMLQAYSVLQLKNSKSKEQFVLLHQTANTILLYQKGKDLNVFCENNKGEEYVIPNFKVAERIRSLSYSKLQNSYNIGDKTLFIMDSLAIYPTRKVDYLLLTQSPKVNMERVLDTSVIGMVLIDGSNYTNAVAQWKKTCQEKEIPFHFTGEKGAFYFD